MEMVVFRGELSNRFPPVHEPAVRRGPVADERVPHFWDCRDGAIVEHHEAHHETSAGTATNGPPERPFQQVRGALRKNRGSVAPGARHREPRHNHRPARGRVFLFVGHLTPPGPAFPRLTDRGTTIHHRRHR
ncbi:hypothetical protein B1H29_20505 [Streptomyces pactum]|uniref:Uncharacterized protein n=1 Tax=Streptomyces pactum TaxID=68249 RepID=A0A1S6JK09_9ACTN|nr:hypothetical protein B1H29_20505 [Streptomyces pactum]